MDIVTHALMGFALARPILPTAPLAGACFILGSVAPDLDALSRLLGKTAFLRCHQTYTHALPTIAAVGVLAFLLFPAEQGPDRLAPLALVAGMLLHVLLDTSNTYGTALLAPFSRRRFSADWVFFIDAPVVLCTLLAIALELSLASPAPIAIGYGAAMSLYWLSRFLLHRQTWRLAPPHTVSLIPSALLPWRYHGFARTDEQLNTFRLSAFTGEVVRDPALPNNGAAYLPALAALLEVRLMRQLTPAYHIVRADTTAAATQLLLRDLRTRNFGGRFGELLITLSPTGQVERSEFHV